MKLLKPFLLITISENSGATRFRRGSRSSTGHAKVQLPCKSAGNYKRQRRALRSSRLTPAGRCTSLLMG